MADSAGSADLPRTGVNEAVSSRRLKLQSAYGQAMMWAKGFAAEETRAAFSRAAELAAKTDNSAPSASRRTTARDGLGHRTRRSAVRAGDCLDVS